MCGIAGYFNPDQNYAENPKQNFHTPVSYTHLTLPTT